MEDGGHGVSRRALFGAGLGRLLEAHVPAAVEEQRPRRQRPEPAFAGWGEGDAARLGARLEPVAAHLLDTCGVGAGIRVSVAAAGDGVPADGGFAVRSAYATVVARRPG